MAIIDIVSMAKYIENFGTKHTTIVSTLRYRRTEKEEKKPREYKKKCFYFLLLFWFWRRKHLKEKIHCVCVCVSRRVLCYATPTYIIRHIFYDNKRNKDNLQGFFSPKTKESQSVKQHVWTAQIRLEWIPWWFTDMIESEEVLTSQWIRMFGHEHRKTASKRCPVHLVANAVFGWKILITTWQVCCSSQRMYSTCDVCWC